MLLRNLKKLEAEILKRWQEAHPGDELTITWWGAVLDKTGAVVSIPKRQFREPKVVPPYPYLHEFRADEIEQQGYGYRWS